MNFKVDFRLFSAVVRSQHTLPRYSIAILCNYYFCINDKIICPLQWEKLADPLIWMEAASQIFYSTGLAFGCILAFASYNPTHQNTLKDAITISLVNSGTSLFASIVVFSILGFR